MKGISVKTRSARRETVRRGRIAFAAAAWAAAVLAVLAANPAGAVVFPNLYRLTVTPDPEAGDRRAAAIDLAMRQLLTRITGERDPGMDPALQGLIANASTYVSYFGMDGDRAQIEFYSNQVERELASLNQRIWGPERPLTLLWIAIDGGQGERILLSADGIGMDGLADGINVAGVSPELVELGTTIREQIEAVEQERGLPVALPLLDLEDLGSVSFADISGGFFETVEAASVRYGADAILIGRVRVNPFGNSVQWTLIRGQERSTFSGTEIADGMHWVADTYAQDYSVLGGARSVRLVVRDVASLDDYGRVMSYLEGLSALQSIDVEAFDAGLLSLRASARGDVSVLERMLGLGRVLQLDRESPSVADNTLVLRVARGPRQ